MTSADRGVTASRKRQSGSNIVECRSEHEYAQRPTALLWGGMRLEIEKIETSWRTPAGKHFRVHTNTHQTFELLYNEAENQWHITQR